MFEFSPSLLSLFSWQASLTTGEWWAYGSAFVVLVGVVGESIAELTEWVKSERKRRRLAKASALVLILGLTGDLIAIRTTQADLARVTRDVGNTRTAAKNAADDAARANSSAQQANKEAGDAVQTAKNAKGVASKAESLAHGARQEADSFEKDIVAAKGQAASAESHLAEALQRAAQATAGLDRLKSPRTLTDVPKLISTLKEFKGTEYTFSSVSADEESISLLQSVDNVLQSAGWKRGKPLDGFPAINVFGKDNPFSVPAALTNGVRISVESPEELSALKSMSLENLPVAVRAAVSLHLSLSSSLSPPEEHPAVVNVVKGTSKTVAISIGKKP